MNKKQLIQKEARMKLLFLLFILFCAGCTTATIYHKQVVVEKDTQGKITKTTVVEEVTQPNLQSKAMPFKYLEE